MARRPLRATQRLSGCDIVEGCVEITVDLDRDDDPNVAGAILIRIHTPNADAIVREVRASLGR